jgi:hypothetical protein
MGNMLHDTGIEVRIITRSRNSGKPRAHRAARMRIHILLSAGLSMLWERLLLLTATQLIYGQIRALLCLPELRRGV